MADGLAPRPCGSCPYRRDVPSGVWSSHEYEKLPPYDNETAEQPYGAFLCHQQNGKLCAGWVGCHDMDNSLALRLAAATGIIDPDTFEAAIDYECPVELWDSGAEAAEHGLAKITDPDGDAKRVMAKLRRKRSRA